MNAVDTYLADLEAKLRRIAGKKTASNVVAEMRGHLEESVNALVAKGVQVGQAEAGAVANLGAVDPRDLVPTDGAPRSFNRMVRMRITFWSFFFLTSVTSWAFWLEYPNNLGLVLFAYLGLSAFAFAVTGAFGARWTFVPMVKAFCLFVVANVLLLSVFCVDVGRPDSPYPRLRSVVAKEHKAAEADWIALGHPSYAELADIRRAAWLYTRPERDLDFLPARALGTTGKYRFPSKGGLSWSQESDNPTLVRDQWAKNGNSLISRYATALAVHDDDQKRIGPAQSQPWGYVLPRMVLPALYMGVLALFWCIVASVVGDIFQSTAVVIVRLLKRKAVEA